MKLGRHLAHICLLVDSYDRAIDHYTNALGFELIEDIALGDGKRWVLVTPGGVGQTSLLLAEASGPAQQERIGDQTGGRVFLFLQTDDFARDHARMRANGIEFLEEPRYEAYGTVAVFRDLYGNRWDLIERKG